MKVAGNPSFDPSQLEPQADPAQQAGTAQQAQQAGQAAPSEQAVTGPGGSCCPQPEAVTRGSTPDAKLGSLMSNLLLDTLDAALLPGGGAAGPQALLRLLQSALALFQAAKRNPEAANKALQDAVSGSKDLQASLATLARDLQADPGSAILSGLRQLSAATERADLPAAERRLSGVLPRQTSTERTGAQAGVSGSRSGRAGTALGTVSGTASGWAGARADARGQSSVGLSGVQLQGQAEARVGVSGSLQGHLRSQLLDANAKLSADAQAYVEANGTATLDKDGFRATGHAGVGVRAEVRYQGDFRTAGTTIGGERVDLNGRVDAQAEVSARASVDADVAATIRPPRLLANVGAEAFAGVKAGVEGSVGIGDFVTLSGHAEAWAGAGAEASVHLGYDDGKLSFGFNLGAAVEVGAGGGFAIEIDVKAIANAIVGGIAELLGIDGLTPEELTAIMPALLDLVGPDGLDTGALEDGVAELRRAVDDALRTAQQQIEQDQQLRDERLRAEEQQRAQARAS